MPFQSAEIAPVETNDIALAFSEGRVERAAPVIRRIDTHLSQVFIAEASVYKLKRPVRLPFVDFSSVELRRAACEAEVHINRRLGSPFYQDVLPVVLRDGDRFALGGEGRIVDWIVVMRRFDQAQQFDELAAAGRLSIDLAIETADRIALMHRAASSSTLCGHAADYRQVIRNLRRTEEGAAARLGLVIADPSPFDRLDSELLRVGPLIERRRAEGKVRRGHGDLHLRNLCFFEGRPEPFDALEFDERLATTDVLYDLAFFLMDLRRVGLVHQANAAMNRYWDSVQEEEAALRLLPFFMALRAAVRMAVAMEAGNLVEAHTYRRLSFELLEPQSPVALAIGGLSGSGKSAVAKAVAPSLPGPAGARLLRSDVLRKRMLAPAMLQRVVSTDQYTPARRAQIYRELLDRAAEAIASRTSVVADATFTVGSAQEDFLSLKGADVRAFWLDAPLSVRIARVASRPKGVSDADVVVAAEQEGLPALALNWTRVDAARPLEVVVAEIRREVGRGAPNDRLSA